MNEHLSNYLKNNYGLCDLEKCKCLKHGWQGTLCQDWKSSNANTFEELREWQKGIKK